MSSDIVTQSCDALSAMYQRLRSGRWVRTPEDSFTRMTLIYETIERGNTSCKAAPPGRGTFPNPSIATGPVHTDIKRINAFAHGSHPLQLTPSNRSKGGPYRATPIAASKNVEGIP